MEITSQAAPGRMHELDWLRVIVTIDLIPFHVAWMMTSVAGFSFVEKDTASWRILHAYVQFISPLHMYLLFLIAGTSAFLSLGRRSAVQYVKERLMRLLLPLFVFMLFIFPVLGYFWPPGQPSQGIGFWKEFLPWCWMTTLYSPVTGGPNWAHMWFAGYLFIYSILLLPAFLKIRNGKDFLSDRLTGFLTGRTDRVFLAGIPAALAFAVLAPIWPFFRNNLYSDWGYFTYNLTAFFIGFIIIRDPRWAESFRKHAPLSFTVGIIFSAAKIFMQYRLPAFSTPAYNIRYILYSLIAGFNTWFWIIAILSIARGRLAFTNRFLKYFKRISYTFYIFHLAVITVAGYFIKRLRLGCLREFLVLCVISFVLSAACCEIGKSNRVTRFLLGIKGK